LNRTDGETNNKFSNHSFFLLVCVFFVFNSSYGVVALRICRVYMLKYLSCTFIEEDY